MNTLVDLRRWRIEADPARLIQPDGSALPPRSRDDGRAGGAEIILFPIIARALAERPRKSLKRRFARRAGNRELS